VRDGFIPRQLHATSNSLSRKYRFFFHAQILPRQVPRPRTAPPPSPTSFYLFIAQQHLSSRPSRPAYPLKNLAPFPPSAIPVIPTGAGRRICCSASLLRCSRPEQWRDLSSLFISVKTQSEDNTASNRHRGSGRPLSPATPPYMRVRIRRFSELSPRGLEVRFVVRHKGFAALQVSVSASPSSEPAKLSRS
jgi:hypothetical protein